MKCPKCHNTTLFTLEFVASAGVSIDLGQLTDSSASDEYAVERVVESLSDCRYVELNERFVQCDNEDCEYAGPLATFGEPHEAFAGLMPYEHGDEPNVVSRRQGLQCTNCRGLGIEERNGNTVPCRVCKPSRE